MLLAPLIIAVAVIALVTSRIVRGGWVRRNVGALIGSAHPPRKIRDRFWDTSIHRLSLGYLNPKQSRARWLETGFVTTIVTLGRR
jgi:hypothetical protein